MCIRDRAKCYESLLYYHYGSKDKLFAAVLENAYRKLVEAEAKLLVDFDDPRAALEAVVRFMWRYYQEHPELIFLLNTENLLKGKHLKKASGIRDFFPNAITLLRKAVESGMAQGLFRPDVHIDDLYITVMGLGYFYLSNRHTLSAFFDKELLQQAELQRWGDHMVETVLRVVQQPPAQPQPRTQK